jgi:exonuclease SbcC
MMQILSIHLRNIKSHRDTELTFSPGINVLSGPNGIGKSTVFEAIGYALFGVDAQSFVGNIERFISIGARKGEISVAFRVDDQSTWRVTRTVGAAGRWLLARETATGFEVEEHKDARETEARVKELLGLESSRSLAEQFELVIGPFQNDFLGPFVIRQPAKRRDKFDEILGIDTWRKTFSETNTLLKAIKGKVEVLQAEIGSRQEQIEVLPVKKAELNSAGKELDQTQKDFARHQQDLTQIEARLVDLDTREQAIRKLQGEIATHSERISNGREKIGAQQERIREAEQAQQVIAATAAGKEAFEKASARLSALRDRQKSQRLLEQEAAALDKKLSELKGRHESEIRAIEQVRDELRQEEESLAQRKTSLAPGGGLMAQAERLPVIRKTLDSLRKQLGRLEGSRTGITEGSEKLAEGVCPFFQESCLNIADHPPEDIFAGKLAELDQERLRLGLELEKQLQDEAAAGLADEQLRALRIQLQAVEQEAAKIVRRRKANEERSAALQGLQKEREAVQILLTEKESALSAFSRLEEDIEAAELEQRRHQDARDRYLANQKDAAELDQRRAELNRFQQLLDRLLEGLAELEAALKEANGAYDASRHQLLRGQKDELRETIGILRQKMEGLNASIVRLTAEIDKLKRIEKEIEKKKSRACVFGEKEELVKFLRNRVFRNVSAYLSERFRQEISLRADKIYRTIAEVDEELYWGEDYRIVLRDMAEGEIRERSDDQLSGGQTMSAVVALRLALLQTIGARIAFFDEPTSNLDAARRENLARAFRAIDVGREEVTEHWYDQLFLISHDVAFTEITDQIIELGR